MKINPLSFLVCALVLGGCDASEPSGAGIIPYDESDAGNEGDGVIVIQIPTGAPDMTSSGSFSIEYGNASVRDVLIEVAEYEGFEVVLPPKSQLNGTTNLNLKNVTWRQVYDLLIQPYGLRFVKENNRVLILTENELQAMPLVEERIHFAALPVADFYRHYGDDFLDNKMNETLELDVDSNSMVLQLHPVNRELVLAELAQWSGAEAHLPALQAQWPDDLSKIDTESPYFVSSEKLPEQRTIAYPLEIFSGRIVMELVKQELPDLAVIFESRTNMLILKGTAKQVNDACRLIAFLDDERWMAKIK